jgi:hypothetical protein
MVAEAAAAWVYAVVPAGTVTTADAPTGVAGEPVQLIQAAGLAAAVGVVPPDHASEQLLRQRLQDPVWLQGAVRCHHAVVAALFAQAPTVPFRLATVYLGPPRVRRLLEERSAALRRGLDLVTGRAEWGVLGYPAASAPAASAPAALEPARGDARTDRPGTSYLLRRQCELADRERARAAAVADAQRVDAVLAPVAVAEHRPPARSRAAPGEPAAPLLNTSYLVDSRHADPFVAAVRRLAGELAHLRLRLTGPMPAYSFVDAEPVPA